MREEEVVGHRRPPVGPVELLRLQEEATQYKNTLLSCTLCRGHTPFSHLRVCCSRRSDHRWIPVPMSNPVWEQFNRINLGLQLNLVRWGLIAKHRGPPVALYPSTRAPDPVSAPAPAPDPAEQLARLLILCSLWSLVVRMQCKYHNHWLISHHQPIHKKTLFFIELVLKVSFLLQLILFLSSCN